jgi:hypothetical protein
MCGQQTTTHYLYKNGKKLCLAPNHYVMSMGAACFCADVLKLQKVRLFSSPFDWCYGGDFITRIKQLKNQFGTFFIKSDFHSLGQDFEKNDQYINEQTKLIYNHDFSHNVPFNKQFSNVARKYKRRCDRVLEILSNPENYLLLVYGERGDTNDKFNREQILKILDELNTIYPATIQLLYLRNNPNCLSWNGEFLRASNTFYETEYINKQFTYRKELKRDKKNIHKFLHWITIRSVEKIIHKFLSEPR